MQRISSRDMPSSIDAVIHLTTLKGGSYLTGLLYMPLSFSRERMSFLSMEGILAEQ